MKLHQIIIDVPEGYEIDQDERSEDRMTIQFKKIEKPKAVPDYAIKSGIFIIKGDQVYIPDEWGNRPADGVLLATPHWFIAIDRKAPDKCMEWSGARDWARARKIYGRQCDLFDRYQGLHIFDNLEEINASLKAIGGDIIPGEWHWTKDEVKMNPRCAFVVLMGSGCVYGSSRKYTLICGRAVSAFPRF